MKQNLQTPATPLEMLSLFLPAGLLDYFDLVNHVSQETCFFFQTPLGDVELVPSWKACLTILTWLTMSLKRLSSFFLEKSLPFYIPITSTFQRFLPGNRSARLSCSRQGCISTHQAASLGRPGNRTNL